MNYSIIYADPPYFYNKRTKNGRFGGGASSQYSMMTNEELLNIGPWIKEISHENCGLFLWTTPTHHEFAYQLMREWGFIPKNYGFTWTKMTKDGKKPRFLTGYYTKGNSEICLFGTRGKITPISNYVGQAILEPLREHSRKPDTARDRIVQLFGDVKRIELFARKKTEGWDSLGNDLNGKDIRDKDTWNDLLMAKNQTVK